MSARNYANAPATTLSSSVTALATNIDVTSITGLPISYPYILILDRGTASEEVVLVTAGTGTSLTVERGYDGTTAFSHSSAASVEHGISAIDAREANEHVNATSGVHGVTGDVVGTTDAQVVTNKDLTDATNTFPASLAAAADLATHEADTSAHGVTGAVVGTSDAQALSNKTISAATNTFSDLPSDVFVVTDSNGDIDALDGRSIPTGEVVGTTDTQTLTNKTLDSPTITGVGRTLGIVKLADEGKQVQAGIENDDELVLALTAGTWIFDLLLLGSADGTGNDLIAAMTYSGTLSFIRFGIQGPETAMTTTSTTNMRVQTGTSSGDTVVCGLNTGLATVRLTGSLVATGSGNLRLQWGANGGLAVESSYIQKGSWMRVQRVA